MAAILLQAFVSPGLRIMARVHFHLDCTLLQMHDQGDGHDHADTDADAAMQNHPHPHPHPHGHPHLATHEHNVESNDVVYVDTQNSEPPSGQAFNRVALDLDGLLLHREPPSVDTPAHSIFAKLALRFRTRVEPPLERPPRDVI